jgi:ribonuclease HI
MRADDRRARAAQLLTRLSREPLLSTIADSLKDIDRAAISELLLFAADSIPPGVEHGDKTLILYVDGASLGNPGPAGAGFVILDENNRELEKIARPLGVTTNNVAEYSALIIGLKRARELGANRVTVRSDSELMVKQMTGAYRIKDEKLRVLAQEVTDIIDSFDLFDILHIDREKNRTADRLSKLAAEKGGK